MKRLYLFASVFALLLLSANLASAQRVASPRGESATQIGDAWIVVDYSRPILRGRNGIFGSGEDYGKTVMGNAEVWRLGANKSTRLMTEVDMVFEAGTLPAGEYSLFADLAEDGWMLIISNHEAKDSGRDEGPGLWGAYGYSEDMDVLRVPMEVTQREESLDQMTISFIDVTDSGGTIQFSWDTVTAWTTFSVGQ